MKTDPPVASYDYFPDGLVRTIHYANGAVTTYVYYPNRWIQSIDTRTAAGRRISRYEYEYDANGNRTLMREWNATPAWRAAHPAWETDPDDIAEHEVTAYAYDRLDRLTGVTYRYGTADQRAVAYTYDLLGNRLSEIETKLDGSPVKDRSFAYDRHGRLLTVTDHLSPARSVKYAYNAAGDTLSKIIGQLDGAGGIVPGTEALRLNFGWDAWGRLRRVTRQTAAAGKRSQAKTGDGRRETGAESGQTSAGTAVYALGEEELVAEFCYDSAGRRIRQDGRFAFLGDGAGGAGDPVPADTRLYVYDEMSALAEFTFAPALPGDPDALVKVRQYLYGNELLSAESVPPTPEPPAPSPVFYHVDSLGSTVNLTAADGSVAESYLYDAWGNYRELDRDGPDGATFDGDAGYDPATGLWDWIQYLSAIQSAFNPSLEPPAPSLASWNRFTYTGHEFDPATGLYYFKARFYDPELGRFASADPYLGDSLTPPSLHRYLYAYANPSRYVDLTGYFSEGCAPYSDRELKQDISRQSEINRSHGITDPIWDDWIQPMLEGVVDVVREPTYWVADDVVVVGVWAHNKIYTLQIDAKDVHLKSSLANELKRQLESGKSPDKIIREAGQDYAVGVVTLGTSEVVKTCAAYYRGEIDTREFRRRMIRHLGNYVGAMAAGVIARKVNRVTSTGRQSSVAEETDSRNQIQQTRVVNDVQSVESDPSIPTNKPSVKGVISDPLVVESTGARITKPGTIVGSARTFRSVRTSVRASIGEDQAYKGSLLRGEIGLQAPGIANEPGVDYITAIEDASGQIKIVITDVKTSSIGKFPNPDPSLPQSWIQEARAAVSPERLNIGDPALEARIREAVTSGRIVRRQVIVDYSPKGQGRINGY